MTECPEIRLAQFDDQSIDGLEFCAMAYEMLEQLRQMAGGISTVRLRADEDAKKLVEEILPICQWVHSAYRPGRAVNVCWKNGNQNYDAKVFQRGALADLGLFPKQSFLEVKGAYRGGGSADYQLRKLLDGGDPVPAKHRSGRYFIVDFSRQVLAEVQKKALKTYLISTEPPPSHLMSLRRRRLLITEAYGESDDGDEPSPVSTGVVDG